MGKDEVGLRCSNEGCRRAPRPSRKECDKCAYRRLKEKDPVRYAYLNLRKNAKRRKKNFDITIEEFREWCIKTDYIRGKGKKSDSYHIDRIDETKGYSIDNIQVLTNAENYRKYLDYKWGGESMEYTTRIITQKPIDDVPF